MEDTENHHHLYLENNQNHSNIQPSVTFQLLPIIPYDISSSVKTESVIISRDNLSSLQSRTVPVIQTTPLNHDTTHFIEKFDDDDTAGDDETTGVHFLTDDEVNNGLLVPKLEPNDTDSTYYVDTIDSGGIKSKVELLEYVHRDDGTVMCKVCGQILASRTHWYRHKYKVHIVNPSPLFKCTKCNVFFKSRRGYIGHLHSRHPKQKTSGDDQSQPHRTSTSSTELDVVEHQTNTNILTKKSTEHNNSTFNMKSTDWEIQREKEEKLVADIIDRVKRECEAQGTTVTRRGYSRRQTIMNS